MSSAYQEAIVKARAAVLEFINGKPGARVGVFSADLNNRLVDLELATLEHSRLRWDVPSELQGATIEAGQSPSAWHHVDQRRILDEVCTTADGGGYDVYILVDWRGGGEPALEVEVGTLADHGFPQVLEPPEPEVLARPLITLTMVVPQKIATPALHIDWLFEFGEADHPGTHDRMRVLPENLATLRARGVDV